MPSEHGRRPQFGETLRLSVLIFSRHRPYSGSTWAKCLRISSVRSESTLIVTDTADNTASHDNVCGCCSSCVCDINTLLYVSINIASTSWTGWSEVSLWSYVLEILYYLLPSLRSYYAVYRSAPSCLVASLRFRVDTRRRFLSRVGISILPLSLC